MAPRIARLVAGVVAVAMPILLMPAESGAPARTFVDDLLTD
jgi:hypothetical protein